MNWNQPVCDDDWEQRNPGREPYRFSEEVRELEVCCYCGKTTRSGIYVRIHPSEVPYPAKDDES